MSRLLRATLALAAGVAVFTPPVSAQQVPVRDLPKPAREIEDPFSLVSGAMEFKPGRILLFDAVDGELVIELADREVVVGPGQFFTVPAGMPHRTRPRGERSVNLTFERVNAEMIFEET